MVSENGNTYVVWDAHYRDISKKIQSLMDSGYKCCLITKDSPGALASPHQNLKVVQVSEDRAGDSIPLTPEHILGNFENFVKANADKAVVVLDVFDNLLNSEDTSFTNAYTLLNIMIDVTAINNNILFVPISTKSLDEREKILIRDCGVNEISETEEKPPRKGFFGRKRKRE
jgi:hypothetical protein